MDVQIIIDLEGDYQNALARLIQPVTRRAIDILFMVAQSKTKQLVFQLNIDKRQLEQLKRDWNAVVGVTKVTAYGRHSSF